MISIARSTDWKLTLERWNLKGKFLRESIIKYQNWLSEEVIDLPGSEDFQTCILMLLLEEILWSRQLEKKKETGLNVPGGPFWPCLSQKWTEFLHVLFFYFSVCTALDAPWREAGKIFPSMHAWPGTLWLSLGWYFLLVWDIREAAAGAVGTVWRATVVLCSRVFFSCRGLAAEHYLDAQEHTDHLMWYWKGNFQGPQGYFFLPMSLAKCIGCLLESRGHI